MGCSAPLHFMIHWLGAAKDMPPLTTHWPCSCARLRARLPRTSNLQAAPMLVYGRAHVACLRFQPVLLHPAGHCLVSVCVVPCWRGLPIPFWVLTTPDASCNLSQPPSVLHRPRGRSKTATGAAVQFDRARTRYPTLVQVPVVPLLGFRVVPARASASCVHVPESLGIHVLHRPLCKQVPACRSTCYWGKVSRGLYAGTSPCTRADVQPCSRAGMCVHTHVCVYVCVRVHPCVCVCTHSDGARVFKL